MLLNKFRLPGILSSHIPSSKKFDLTYQQLIQVYDYKNIDVEKTLTFHVNRQKITELVFLSDVIAHKIKNSTLIQDLKAYYAASAQAQKKMSQPVSDSQDLKNIVQTDQSTACTIAALTQYYTQFFEKLSITQIIKAGYSPGQRNDLATAITHALPDDNPHRHMFDQFYQLGASLRAVKGRVEKARREGALDQIFLDSQYENLERVAPQIHFLQTIEDETASRLSILFEKLISAFGSQFHQDLVADLKKDIRVLADGASSFKEQHDMISNMLDKIEARKSIEDELRFQLKALIEQTRRQMNIPNDADALKTLEVISHLRAKLVEYHALHMPMSVGGVVNKVKESVNKTKVAHVDAVIHLLDQFVKEIREGKRVAASLMQQHDGFIDELEEIDDLHQLMYWIRSKMPNTSNLYQELVSTYELSTQKGSRHACAN